MFSVSLSSSCSWVGHSAEGVHWSALYRRMFVPYGINPRSHNYGQSDLHLRSGSHCWILRCKLTSIACLLFRFRNHLSQINSLFPMSMM